jgi:hypothetical protein
MPHAAIRPNRCAVIPFIGNHNAKAGFFDTGQDMRGDDHVYISVEAVEDMARAMGWGPKDVVLAARVERQEKEIADLKVQVAEADRFAEAAEYTLERFGSKVRAKPGRKAAA